MFMRARPQIGFLFFFSFFWGGCPPIYPYIEYILTKLVHDSKDHAEKLGYISSLV